MHEMGHVGFGEAGNMGAGKIAADHMVGDQSAHPVHFDDLDVPCAIGYGGRGAVDAEGGWYPGRSGLGLYGGHAVRGGGAARFAFCDV